MSNVLHPDPGKPGLYHGFLSCSLWCKLLKLRLRIAIKLSGAKEHSQNHPWQYQKHSCSFFCSISSSPNTLPCKKHNIMNMEEQEEEKHTTSDSPSADESLPPHPHREHNPLPPPESSPADSPVSYQTSHGFSPRGYKTPPADVPEMSPSPVVVVNRSVREEPKMLTKVDPGDIDGIASLAMEEGGGASARRGKLSLSILRRPKRERAVERAALGLRVFGFLFCLVSFSIMASDKNQGWTLDSFDRYKEFRYCLSVNVIGFVYSGLQGCDLAYHLETGQHGLRHHLRRHLDFFMDQVLTYLLISASSSAATRVEDWQSNWGKDKFPEMARASVWMSFLAFVAFASSSLISGYILFTYRSIY